MKTKYHPLHNKKGQGLTEYLVLLILVAVLSIAATKSLGTTIRKKFRTANTKINGISFDEYKKD